MRLLNLPVLFTLLTPVTFLLPCLLSAQSLFPIKKDKKWGLINADGRIVQQPVYDAIGEFKDFGYAVMQRDRQVGMLDNTGREIVPPQYDDVKVLDSTLVSVFEKGDWKVIDLSGKVVLAPGYERVEILAPANLISNSLPYLAFMRDKKWGVVDGAGRQVAAPAYDEITVLKELPEGETGIYFQVKNDNLLGLLLPSGGELIAPQMEEVRVFNDNLFLYKKDMKWGGVDREGLEVLQPSYSHFSRLSGKFIKLVARGKAYLFSLVYNKLVTDRSYEAYYPFSDDYVLCKKDRLLGLVDHCGSLVLTTKYDEIQPYDGDVFRASLDGRWGIVTLDDLTIIPYQFDYIAPMQSGLCVVIQNKKLGVANQRGEVVVPPQFDRIELEGDRAKAHLKGKLTLLQFNDDRRLAEESKFAHHFTIRVTRDRDALPVRWSDTGSPYQLEKFEWFYSPKHDKWGLRRLDNGQVQIEPSFHQVQVEKELGLTLVGIEIMQEMEFDRTSYRYEMAYGLVQNDTGLLVHEVDLVDVRLPDFDRGLPVARCIFTNGKHGLVNRIGKIIRKDFGYIGDFHNGVARASAKGKTSASRDGKPHHLGSLRTFFSNQLAPVTLTDYTQHDLNIDRFGYLSCEECTWGYIDTTGAMVVQPQYTFAKDFVNEVGIVAEGDKWGMVDNRGKSLLPCHFDELGFVEKTGNTILRIFKKEEKYGLIDTLGRLAVSVQYDEIGSFGDGRLAVKRYGRWGFVDRNGREVVPCRFDEVKVFSEGLAAVRLENKWGYIDKNGNVELDFQFSRAGYFNSGLAPVKGDGPYTGYIDRQGEWVLKPDFQRAHEFDRGLARVVEMSGDSYRTGLIDTTGKFVVRPRFTSIGQFDHNGLAVVAIGGSPMRYGLINLRGDIITSHSYRTIEPFAEGLARVKGKDGWGYVNLKGQLAIDTEYSKASDFSEGRAAVWKDGRCGFIDASGRMIVEPEFSRCMDFKDGKAIVFMGNQRAGLIDTEGNFVIEPGINRLLDFAGGRGLVRDEHYKFYYITEQARFYDGYYEKAGQFRHGVAVVQVDGHWAIINQQGIEIIPPKYDKIEQFEDGYAKVRIKGFNGLTNLQGEMIVQPDYEYISYAGEGLFRVEQGDKVGYFDMEGKWVWGLQE